LLIQGMFMPIAPSSIPESTNLSAPPGVTGRAHAHGYLNPLSRVGQ
ncbi:hypothetical protein L8106_08101, partial [Lyngbya sp. PCC 8106]